MRYRRSIGWSTTSVPNRPPRSNGNKTVKALVIGSGGAEHALTRKLAESPAVTIAYTAYGNYGTHLVGVNVNIPTTDPEALAAWAAENTIDLTIANDPTALAYGIVDVFRERGLRILGATRAEARLETAKIWAKAFLTRHDIPTPPARDFTDPEQAAGYLATAACSGSVKSRAGGVGMS